MITVEAMLKARLEEIGADGLCDLGDGCGCGIGDLAPCESPSLDGCVAARKIGDQFYPLEDDA